MKTRTKVLLIVIPIFLILFAIPLILVFVSVAGVYFATKNMEEFTCAIQLVNENKEAKAVLGDNIEENLLLMPNIKIEGARRIVDLYISVSGSIDSADLYINSHRDNFRDDYLVWIEHNSKQIRIHKGTYPCK